MRNGKLPQVAIDALVREVGDVRRPELPAPIADRHVCNQMEAIFLGALAMKRPGAKTLRHGWPDFLVEHNGETFGVEVKNVGDSLRPGQRAMFAALGKVGIKVYVWHPRRPDILTPWWNHCTAKVDSTLTARR